MDWESITTLIKVDVYETLLWTAGYDAEKSRKLVTGFREGFDIGYEGPETRRDFSQNIPLRGIGTKVDLWNKVMKEVKLGRFAGPFKLEDLPFDNFIQSPIGLVPKAGGQTRLIFHLSYDFNSEEGYCQSLNASTPKDKCHVKYNDLDHAIQICLDLLKECGVEDAIIFFRKSDLKSAFRILPILPRQRKWLLMKA